MGSYEEKTTKNRRACVCEWIAATPLNNGEIRAKEKCWSFKRNAQKAPWIHLRFDGRNNTDNETGVEEMNMHNFFPASPLFSLLNSLIVCFAQSFLSPSRLHTRMRHNMHNHVDFSRLTSKHNRPKNETLSSAAQRSQLIESGWCTLGRCVCAYTKRIMLNDWLRSNYTEWMHLPACWGRVSEPKRRTNTENKQWQTIM